MLQGRGLRLHKGTVCYITSAECGTNKVLEGEQCTVLSFDAAESRWRVQMEGGKEIAVSHSSLRLGYCHIPSALDENEIYCQLAFEAAQGECGRGLVIKQALSRGQLVFQEPPFMVASSWGDLSHGATSREHHAERWLAYCALERRARQEEEAGGGDELWSTALSAFHELGFATAVPSHVKAGADFVCEKHARTVLAGGTRAPASASSSSSSSDPEVKAHGPDTVASQPSPRTRRVTETLMRFNCNQFGLSNGGTSGSRFCASALYAFTSRVNHSCDPTISIASKEAHLKAHGMPFDVEKDGGVIVAYALRDLAPGDRLTFNYASTSMSTAGEEWPVNRRRQFLLEKMGFVCGCQRCEQEAANEDNDASKALANVTVS